MLFFVRWRRIWGPLWWVPLLILMVWWYPGWTFLFPSSSTGRIALSNAQWPIEKSWPELYDRGLRVPRNTISSSIGKPCEYHPFMRWFISFVSVILDKRYYLHPCYFLAHHRCLFLFSGIPWTNLYCFAILRRICLLIIFVFTQPKSSYNGISWRR